MKINWNEKPDWADVWIEDKEYPDFSGWHKDRDTAFIDDGGGQYLKCTLRKDLVISYPPETKPSQVMTWQPTKEWNGKGFPPVGTVCDTIYGFSEYRQAEIKYYDDDIVLIKTTARDFNDSYVVLPLKGSVSIKFRPIKSDKEKWVDQAMGLKHIDRSVILCPRPALVTIYDAMESGTLALPKVTK